MTILPIVARELRVASRRRSTYWLRTSAALVVLLAGIWMFLAMKHDNQPSHEIGQFLFGLLSGSAVVYGLFSGARSTADCLSEEKRAGTMGLLFLTDLKGYDVVLGKLVASSVTSVYAMVAMVPMLGLPLLLGGVTLGQFARATLVAANALFFSLSLGMCVSSMSRSARKATSSTIGLMLFFNALLPFAAWWLAMHGKGNSHPYLTCSSSGFCYFLSWDGPFAASRDQFWFSVAVIHALSWLFLAVASLVSPRSWQERPSGVKALRWRERWKLWGYGNSAERQRFRKRLLDSNAFYWLAARMRLKPIGVWAALGIVGCFWAWGMFKVRHEWFTIGIYIITAVILNVILKGWVALESGRQLAEERQAGALELILSTPLTTRDIMHGQLLALSRQFLGPLVVALAVQFIFLLASLNEPMPSEERTCLICIWLGSMVLLYADVLALYWVGMWQGLIVKHPARVGGASVMRILTVPWIAFGVIALAVGLGTSNSSHDPGWQFYVALWLVCSLAADIFFAGVARHKLLTEFRLAAAREPGQSLRKWKRTLGLG